MKIKLSSADDDDDAIMIEINFIDEYGFIYIVMLRYLLLNK